MSVLRSAATVALKPFGTRVVTVRSGPIAGSRMALDLAHEKSFWTGGYEPEVQELIGRLNLAGRTAWDIGAHAGFFTLMLARTCDRVLAVEATPTTAERLRRNVALNDAPVDVVEAAVTAASGEVTFDAVDGGRRAQSSVSEGGSLRVRAVTLDELLDSAGPPTFVKMDIEGAELPALRAAPRLLAARPVILCEVHRGKKQRAATAALLEEAGYAVEWSGWRIWATTG